MQTGPMQEMVLNSSESALNRREEILIVYPTMFVNGAANGHSERLPKRQQCRYARRYRIDYGKMYLYFVDFASE